MSSRRGHGEGVIHRRESDGRWTAAIELSRASDGGRQRKWVYGKTRKEVAEKLKALRAGVDAGIDVQKSGMTVERLFADWLELIIKPSTRPRTIQSYELMVRTHILPRYGRQRVTTLNTRDIDTFLREKENEGLSPRTVSYLRSILRQALNQAIRWDVVSRNVVQWTTPPKSNPRELPDLTTSQIHQLRASFRGHRYEAVYILLLGVGLRLGEALGVRWEDVELDGAEDTGGCVHVRVQLQFIDGSYQLTLPKSRASKRALRLPPLVAAALRARKERQNAEARTAGAEWSNPFNLVNTNLKGGPLDHARVRQRFKELLTASDLPAIRLHDCRHLAATLLVEENVHPRMVMAVLGHSQMSLTMDRYAHIRPSATQAAADALEAALGGP